MIKLNLIRERVYGRILYYPACEYSKALCEAFEVKTISENQYEILKKWGCKMKLVTEMG